MNEPPVVVLDSDYATFHVDSDGLLWVYDEYEHKNADTIKVVAQEFPDWEGLWDKVPADEWHVNSRWRKR